MPDVIVVVVVVVVMMMEESSGSYGIVRFGVRSTTVNELLQYSLSLVESKAVDEFVFNRKSTYIPKHRACCNSQILEYTV